LEGWISQLYHLHFNVSNFIVSFLRLSITEAYLGIGQSKRITAERREFDQHLEGWISQPYHFHFNVYIFIVFLLYLFLLQKLIWTDWQSKRSTAKRRKFDQHLEGWISQPYHLHFNVSIFVVFLFYFFQLQKLIWTDWQSKRNRAGHREFDQHLEGWISQTYHLHFNVSIFVIVL